MLALVLLTTMAFRGGKGRAQRKRSRQRASVRSSTVARGVGGVELQAETSPGSHSAIGPTIVAFWALILPRTFPGFVEAEVHACV